MGCSSTRMQRCRGESVCWQIYTWFHCLCKSCSFNIHNKRYCSLLLEHKTSIFYINRAGLCGSKSQTDKSTLMIIPTIRMRASGTSPLRIQLQASAVRSAWSRDHGARPPIVSRSQMVKKHGLGHQ